MKNNLSVRERSAISSLRNSGVAVKSLAGAFGVSTGIIYSTTKTDSLSGARSSSVKAPAAKKSTSTKAHTKATSPFVAQRAQPAASWPC